MKTYEKLTVIDYDEIEALVENTLPIPIKSRYWDKHYKTKELERFNSIDCFTGGNFKNDMIIKQVYNVSAFDITNKEYFQEFYNFWIGLYDENEDDVYFDGELDSTLLDWLCFCGKLEAGNYLVRISW